MKAEARRKRSIVVTATENQEMIAAGVLSAALYGKPRSLKGMVSIKNLTSDKVKVRELPLSVSKSLKEAGFPICIETNIILQPNETVQTSVSVSLPKQTVSKEYKAQIVIGKDKVATRLMVEDDFRLEVHPSRFITQGVKANQKYTFSLDMINKGNMDYVIPKLGHSIILDGLYRCKAKSWALKNDAKNGEQAFQDGQYKKVARDLSDWVVVSVSETGQTLKIGDTMKLNVTVTLPEKINPDADYEGDIVIGKQLLKYQILA